MTDDSEAIVPTRKGRKKPGRVPTSCAECRRLKLRCDRKVPCENCFKRGCGSICPAGSLTTGRGNRLVLTSTSELHNTIESLSARIRELEDALAKKSDGSRDLASTQNSPDPRGSTEEKPSNSVGVRASSSSEPETDSFIDAFGTLMIGSRGETSFMSSTARSEYLVAGHLHKAPTWATLVQNLRLPARVINASVLDHDVTPVDNELRELVMSYRPPLSEAIRLCEVYLEWSKTMWTPLSRGELLDEIAGSVYRANSYETIPDPHAPSLLFSIFALASLLDFSRPPYSIEAYEYYILSRVALEFTSPCAITTLHTVFTLANNIQWLDLSNLQVDPSFAYALAGQGVKLAYQMGLHLHSARFRLEKSISQKRSTVFWQIFLMDTVISFFAGRPPNVSLDWVDVPFPDDEFPVKNSKGELEMSWRSYSWRFSKLLHEVMVAAFGAKIPTYNTILELDRKMRDFPVPPHLQLRCMTDTQVEPQLLLQQLFVLTTKEAVLLNIHRRYFSQALQDSPADPLKHKYGPSVMAMYRSAWRLIVSHTTAVDLIPELMARLALFWSQALSAAIVMCMIVHRAPSSNMSASSLRKIDELYDVFRKAAPTTKNASNLLDHVEKIWRKGHENDDHSCSTCTMAGAELDRVGGGSTSIIPKDRHVPPLSCHGSSPDSSTPFPNSSIPTSASNSSYDSLLSIHPRIMQDMQSFDGFQTSSSATNGRDYSPPEQFSRSMVDTQYSQFIRSGGRAQEALNTSDLTQPLAFHPPNETQSVEGITLDSTWQSFMEQLGF